MENSTRRFGAQRDELEQADAIGPVGGGPQKIIRVFPDDDMEHAGLGVEGW